jgi:hypothetical protein
MNARQGKICLQAIKYSRWWFFLFFFFSALGIMMLMLEDMFGEGHSQKQSSQSHRRKELGLNNAQLSIQDG